jgi:hypothetical protein
MITNKCIITKSNIKICGAKSYKEQTECSYFCNPNPQHIVDCFYCARNGRCINIIAKKRALLKNE